MRYLKLLGMFARTSLQHDLEYRTNFIAQTFLGLFWAFTTLISVWVFFTHTSNLGGWSYPQALIVLGVFALINSLIQCFLEPNIKHLIEMVRQGTLDFVLLKPVNSQFMATLRHMRMNGIGDFSAGAMMILYALQQLAYTPSLFNLAHFGLIFSMGFITVYSIWVLIATSSFWLVKVNNLTELFSSVYDTARFPISTFRGGLRIVLTYVMPIAFITTFPAQAMLGQLDMVTTLLAVIIAFSIFIVSNRVWHYAIRNYSSASS